MATGGVCKAKVEDKYVGKVNRIYTSGQLQFSQ